MQKWIFILGFVFFFSCTDDDNGGEVNDDGLEGQWTLTNVSCFCAFGENPDFSATHIIFNLGANELEVSNTGENVYFRENGTYTYLGNDNRLTFNDGRSYTFAINGSELSLVFVDEPNIADDEVSYTFTRG